MLKIFNTSIESSMGGDIRIHGNIMSGRSVEITVKNLSLYFYVKPSFKHNINIETLKKGIEDLKDNDFILKNIEIVEKTNIYGYNKKEKFFKIYYQRKNNKVKESLENGIYLNLNGQRNLIKFRLFESSISPVTRFMTDRNINGMSCIDLEEFTVISGKNILKKEMSEMCFCGGRKSGREKGEAYAVRCDENDCMCKCEEPNQITVLHDRPIDFLPKPERIFLEVSADKIFSDTETIKLPPFVTFSYDIEAFTRDKSFPVASKQHVNQIGVSISVERNYRCSCKEKLPKRENKIYKVLFSLDTITLIPGVELYTFKSEKEMLISFINFLNSVDPDVIIGYNTNDFDTPYINERLQIHKIDFNIGRLSIENSNSDSMFGENIQGAKSKDSEIFFNTGKIFEEFTKKGNNMKIFDDEKLIRKNKKISIKKSFFSSRQQGSRDFNNIDIPGRINIDMLVVLRKDYKLSSYTLNAVSSHFLGEQKEDLPHNMMYGLFTESPDTRRRVAVYCVKDTVLPLRLYQELFVLIRGAEISRVCGIPLNYHFTRGVSIRVFHLILRRANSEDFIIPDLKKSTEDSFEGAIVLSPKKGFYSEPVTVLDFASLYPSIIIANNLCYSTYLGIEENFTILKNDDLIIDSSSDSENKNFKAKKQKPIELKKDFNLQDLDLESLEEENVEKSPSNAKFVKEEKRRGILPKILIELLSSRKKVKREMFDCDDKNLKDILDARQLAIKLTANSVYGFTGASVGQLPCLPISHSVTAYGREMIFKTKSLCEEILTREGFKSEVIYGDTDSVMIRIKDFVKIENVEKIESKSPSKCLCEDCDDAISIPEDGEKKYDYKSLKDLFKICSALANEVSTHFKDPIKLEFEKVYWPYLLMNKKRYAGVMYAGKETKCSKEVKSNLYFNDVCFSQISKTKIDIKGLETVRRDNCGLVRNLITKCLDLLLIKRDTNAACEEVKKVVEDLYMNKTDIGLLVITKQLSKTDYANKQPHVELTKRIKARDPNNAPKLGNRVPYVIIDGKGKLFDKSEDPLYVLDHNLPIDVTYYIERQLSKPIGRVFGPICDPSELFQFKKKKMLVKTSGPLSKFIQRATVCLECKSGDKIICNKCLKSREDNQVYLKHYFKNLRSLNESRDIYSKCWTECQRCQGSVMNEVLCVNTDCSIFFLRKKAQKDSEEFKKVEIKLRDLQW